MLGHICKKDRRKRERDRERERGENESEREKEREKRREGGEKKRETSANYYVQQTEIQCRLNLSASLNNDSVPDRVPTGG